MLILGNGRLLTLGSKCRVIEDGALLIEGEKISTIGETANLQAVAPDADFIDCRGRLIMPGFTCAHTHTYSAFARGMALKDDAPVNFPQILERLWWRLDQALSNEDIFYSALVTFIDSVKNGTTALLDHHAGPNAIEGSLELIASAARMAGIRANLCYEVSDRDGEAKMLGGLEENAAFIKKCSDEKSSMLTASFGMHASFTIGTKTMEKCARTVNDLGAGVHIHAAESREDVDDSLDKYGMGVIERLDKYGLLGDKSMTAHCVHVSDREIELLAASQTNVAHNPQSNMNNAVGCAPVNKMLAAGVVVGMGTDGMSADMLEGLKTAHILHKFCNNDPRAGWKEVPRMQFENNARIMSNYFISGLNELAPGAPADVIVIDYDPPTPLTAENYYGHLVFGVTGRAVETTIVAGKILMQNRVLTEINEQEVKAKARELAVKLWERF
ncbi:MAG: putative aminohydrolase SsnA [Firmicutes bacterium]|nr:putative aminohydrolase SsnA [Bacillota bacterium]